MTHTEETADEKYNRKLASSAELIRAGNNAEPGTQDGNHYNVVRFFQSGRSKRIIARGLLLYEAQAHCSDPETSSSTCRTAARLRYTQVNGAWFDGYEREGR